MATSVLSGCLVFVNQTRFCYWISFSQTIHGTYYNKSWGWTIYLGAESRLSVRPVLSKSGRTAAEADDLRVVSKEALGNSWGILSAILDHKCHQNDPERNLQPKIEFVHVCVFLNTYAPLMFDLDLVSGWRLARFRHFGSVECGYFFLSCTTLVIIDFS